MCSVISLFDLATNGCVRHVNLLAAHSEAIPPVLYESLLKASMRTERILSVRHLFLCWPLQKLSLVNCKEFKEQHALVLAHGLQSGCNMLRVIDLTGCNIDLYKINQPNKIVPVELGVRGTKLFLMLVAGQPLPSVTGDCSNGNRTNKYTAAEYSIEKSKGQPNRLSITTDCYVDDGNYHLFLEVLESASMLHDFTVSYFHAIALGQRRIKRILKKLGDVQAEEVIGLNVEMNSLPVLPRFILVRSNKFKLLKWYQSFRSFSNLQYLNISMNWIGSLTICYILENISAPLTHLVLNNCGFMSSPTDACTKMATLPCIQQLEHLEIENNNLREVGEAIMTLLLKCSDTLLFLSLEKNYLTDESGPAIMQLLGAPFALETLRIGENKFSLNSERLFYSKDKLGRIEGYSNEVQLGSTSKSKT